LNRFYFSLIQASLTKRFLYIRNYQPERMPTGIYRMVTNEGNYGDVDNSPTKNLLLKQKSKYETLFDLSFGKRPREELYDCQKDPYQMHNLAADPAYNEIRQKLSEKLTSHLKDSGDPRETTAKAPWDNGPYYGANK
jgi:N-sulfoglucosamine sulfohydrolase